MANKKEIVLSGMNIYYDKHNRAVYYNKRKNIGYVIPKEQERKMQPLLYRYFLGVVIVIFAYILFHLDILISLGLGIAGALLLEYRFQSVLSSFPQLKNFQPDTSKKASEELKELGKGALVLRIVLYLTLAVLIIVNLFVSEGLLDNLVIVGLSVVVSIAAAFMAIRLILALTKK